MGVRLCLVAALLLLGTAACAPSSDQLLVEDRTDETRFDDDRSMTMAADVLDELDLDAGMVIVPTDNAIFELDADALADLLAGGLGRLVADSVIAVDHGTVIEEWPDRLGDGSGPDRVVAMTGGTWTLDGHPIVDVWGRGGITVVVIDGVPGR